LFEFSNWVLIWFMFDFLLMILTPLVDRL